MYLPGTALAAVTSGAGTGSGPAATEPNAVAVGAVRARADMAALARASLVRVFTKERASCRNDHLLGHFMSIRVDDRNVTAMRSVAAAIVRPCGVPCAGVAVPRGCQKPGTP
ncbi:hypothetical protein GCM10017562_72340 [Streptomyces roseofulvus]